MHKLLLSTNQSPSIMYQTIQTASTQYKPKSVLRAFRLKEISDKRVKRHIPEDNESQRFDVNIRPSTASHLKKKAPNPIYNEGKYRTANSDAYHHRNIRVKPKYGDWKYSKFGEPKLATSGSRNYLHHSQSVTRLQTMMRKHYYQRTLKDFFGNDYDVQTGDTKMRKKNPSQHGTFQLTASWVYRR